MNIKTSDGEIRVTLPVCQPPYGTAITIEAAVPQVIRVDLGHGDVRDLPPGTSMTLTSERLRPIERDERGNIVDNGLGWVVQDGWPETHAALLERRETK